MSPTSQKSRLRCAISCGSSHRASTRYRFSTLGQEILPAEEFEGWCIFDAELVRRTGLAIADAFDLGRVEEIEFYPRWPAAASESRASCHSLGLVGDLAADVAAEAPVISGTPELEP